MCGWTVEYQRNPLTALSSGRYAKTNRTTRSQKDKKSTPLHTNCSLCLPQKLPFSQACGAILGYEIRVSDSEHTVGPLNLSTSSPMNQLECDDTHCLFTSSIKNATSVSLSAYNVHGATTPAYLHKVVTGISSPLINTYFES